MCSRNCRQCRPPPACLRCPPICCEPGVSYCIFDLESAVFDTRHIYQRACVDLVNSYNRTLSEALLLQIRPMETQEMAELICRKCKIPVPWEQFLMQLNELTAVLIANPPLMAGVERLVRHLKTCCIGLALVTSCPAELFGKKILGREKFFELFCTVLCADDPELKQPKPEPDVYLISMCRLGEASTECTLVFDGTPKGVQAAHDARLKVIMLPEKDLPCCWSELATKRLETLEDFQPEEFGIPPYDCDKPPPTPIRKSKRKRGRKSASLGTSRRNSQKLKNSPSTTTNKADEGEVEEEDEEE